MIFDSPFCTSRPSPPILKLPFIFNMLLNPDTVIGFNCPINIPPTFCKDSKPLIAFILFWDINNSPSILFKDSNKGISVKKTFSLILK